MREAEQAAACQENASHFFFLFFFFQTTSMDPQRLNVNTHVLRLAPWVGRGESEKPKRALLPDTFSAPPSFHQRPTARPSSDSLRGPRPGACRWAEPSGGFASHAAASKIIESTYIHTHIICVSFKLDAEDLHAELVTGLEAGPCLACLNTAPLFSGSTKPPLLTLN